MTKSVAADLEGRRETLIKAYVAGEKLRAPASRGPGDDQATAFADAGALEPPYDPMALCLIAEHSNSLRQNLDAYAVNIDGFGHRFQAAIDLDAEDADDRVQEIILLERSLAHGDDGGNIPEPSLDEVHERKRQLQQLARVERARLGVFFDNCTLSEDSFVELRRRTRHDLETTGNAYWEVLRDGRGRLARFVYVPSHTVRLLALDSAPTEITERVRVSSVDFEDMVTRRRLRRFVQLQSFERVYFKSLGDPRAISKATGEVVAEGSPDAATEMIHFAIPSPRTPYGVPRWIGTLLCVLGSREAEEVNHSYFESKTVPPMALLVSGGSLPESNVPRIERFIDEHLRGKKNFHKILILEADGGGSGDTRPRIELKPLTDAQQKDGLFQEYDERNADKVGGAFRLPRILRGESREMNKATAQAALRFAEDQVFQPERDVFDHVINRRVLRDMGIRCWRFVSQTPTTRDPERVTIMIEKLVRVGVLTPEEGRMFAGDVFNRELQKLTDKWVKQPITLTLAGIQNFTPEARANGALSDARDLLRLKENFDDEKRALAEKRARMARESLDVETVRVPVDEFESWFTEREPQDV